MNGNPFLPELSDLVPQFVFLAAMVVVAVVAVLVVRRSQRQPK